MEKQASLQDGQLVFGPVPQLPQILVVQRVERVISGEGIEMSCDDGRKVTELIRCFFVTSNVHQSASLQKFSPLCWKKKSNQNNYHKGFF